MKLRRPPSFGWRLNFKASDLGNRSMFSNRALATMVSISMLVIATPTVAHPKLTSSAPAANETLTNAPGEIRLIFSEGLEPLMSGVELKDEAGETIETAKATLVPTDRKQMIVPLLAPLKPGTYNVSWHVVAADTHRMNGAYTFTVKP